MGVGQEHRGVLLVGSFPLESADEVFRSVSHVLGSRLRRLPDGETGSRLRWVGCQGDVFAENPSFEAVPFSPRDFSATQRYRPKAGQAPEQIQFAPLGYASAAIESYRQFAALQAKNEIPAGMRFQVALPTPLAGADTFVHPSAHAVVEPVYERKVLSELAEICAAIPHDKLAIQWDVCSEVWLWEGWTPPPFPNVKKGIVERLTRISQAVPQDVELGYHLCYGDYQHKHLREPTDATEIVEISNAIADQVKRPIQWLHLPVPRDRTDDAFFAPMKELRLHPETELYLGLIHYSDGKDGTNKRIATAEKFVQRFGVGCECGLGRRPPETVDALLQLHVEVSAPL